MTAEMEEEKTTTTATMWTTWEELLLACAVKRHGLKDWDTVAMEIQTRTTPSLANSYTPEICRDKYIELKRRFKEETPDAAGDDDDGTVPWVEELRKLRVAELTKDVQRYDRSIQSLQLKVERLEQEHKHSRNESEGKNDDVRPDLERSENDKINADDGATAAVLPANDVDKDVSGEHSNRSFNESNTSENREVAGSEPVQTGSGDVKAEPESKTVREEDSCNDSSDTVAKHLASRTKRAKQKDSGELRDSEEASESKEGTTKESSDVQSSASLTKKKRRKQGCGGGGGVNEEEPVVVSTATTTATTFAKREVVVKSEPLVAVMDIIRSHKHGSMFERRLDSQKTDKYNKIVRQHVDLRTVQNRIDDGSYSSCTNKFYLDLLLIFNNAIVYFPKQSTESMAAHELRVLVLKEMRKKPKKPEPITLTTKPDLERSDSLLALAKQKSTAPIIVCRKRSSISGKPSSSNKTVVEREKEQVVAAKPLVIPKPPVKTSSNEDEDLLKMKIKEKPVTGVRSMRRSGNSSRSNSTSNAAPSKNQITSSSSNPANSTGKESEVHGNAGPPKVEKKKAAEVTPMVKKRGAADFLKRLKKNSPAKGTTVEEDGSGGSSKKEPSKKKVEEDGGSSSKKEQVKKKVEERKEVTPLRQKGGSNGGGGRQVKEDVSPSKRSVGRPAKKGKEVVSAKRGREAVEPESASKRPAKRSRR